MDDKTGIETILKLSLQGLKSRAIIEREYIKAHKKENFDNDYREYQQSCASFLAKDGKQMLSEVIQDLWHLYNKNMKVQDYRECKNILKTISDILHLDKASVMEPKKSINKLGKFQNTG